MKQLFTIALIALAIVATAFNPVTTDTEKTVKSELVVSTTYDDDGTEYKVTDLGEMYQMTITNPDGTIKLQWEDYETPCPEICREETFTCPTGGTYTRKYASVKIGGTPVWGCIWNCETDWDDCIVIIE